MDRGAWRATVYGAAKSRTRLIERARVDSTQGFPNGACVWALNSLEPNLETPLLYTITPTLSWKARWSRWSKIQLNPTPGETAQTPPSARSSRREAGSGIYSDTHSFSLRLGWQFELQWKVTTYFLPNTDGESIRGVKAAKMWTPKGAEVRDDHNYREENSPE